MTDVMSNRGLSRWLDDLRRQATAGPEEVGDGELLRRYARAGDQAAFELLVRRHGSLVLGVARRVLCDEHAAEDALQATFLALARRAKALERSETAAGWLYRVAQRIAVRARRRPPLARPQRASPPDPSAAAQWSEIRGILDEEVDRLPEHYRMPVVLCYLAGRTTDEAARQLGCPRGTVLSRLAGAREKLRGRLMRRGVTIPTAALAAGLASESAPTAVSGSLIALALQTTGPAAALAPGVIGLTEGVLHAMLLSKVKVALVVALAAGAMGVSVLAGPGGQKPRAEPPAAAAQVPGKEAPVPRPGLPPQTVAASVEDAKAMVAAFGSPSAEAGETEEAKLIRQKFDTAARELTLRYQEFLSGKGQLDNTLDSARRLRDTAVEMARTPEQRLQPLRAHRAFAEALANLNQARFAAGAIKQEDMEMTKYELLDAELRLLRAQRPAGSR
jgi:RNA polymerase sigma factor (sigma-70 family)